jgi:hypothetical protein
MTGQQDSEPIFLRFLQRFLVWINMTAREILQPSQRKKTRPFLFFAAFEFKALLEKINGWDLVTDQPALFLPTLKESAYAFIGIGVAV